MAFVKKVWKNRISEFFNRYRLENVKTGEAFNAYINLNDGAVEQAGDRLNAESLNDLEDRIEAAFEDVGGSDDMIAGVETTSTASQAYTIGQYLIYNNLLYKVTSAIALGDTLTVGTNIAQKKIAEEVSDHLVVSGTEFYFDTHDGEFGYNTNANRGADTFHPFKSGATLLGTMTSGTQTFTVPANTSVDNIIVEMTNANLRSYGTGNGHSAGGTSAFTLFSKSISGTTLTVTVESPHIRFTDDKSVGEAWLYPTNVNVYLV